MNKAELTAQIAKKANISRAEASAALDATIESITEALKQGETVTLVGFGIFTPKQSTERMGRNPKTGEPAVIPAKKGVSFKVSKGFKDALNP